MKRKCLDPDVFKIPDPDGCLSASDVKDVAEEVITSLSLPSVERSPLDLNDILLKVPFDTSRDTGVSRLATVSGGIFPRGDAKSILAAVSRLDVPRLQLLHLERTETDGRAEPDKNIVAIAAGSSSKLFNLIVSEPDAVIALDFRLF